MSKKPVVVSIRELEDILNAYLDGGQGMNYAVKILGHPGVGKSAVVRQVAERRNYHFIDTRLAFKENVDLGGYPVPDHGQKRMVYYRPKFIPPERVPEGRDGILWFLDESNRAHPTVIQTLFQIITERTCGEHELPERTAIVVAGNLGENDSTTITEFDDAALDGRLAVFHLRPTAEDWLLWARAAGIHQAVIRYIAMFPEKLWDERAINPNPRGWHQVSQAILLSYRLATEKELAGYLRDEGNGSLRKVVRSLVGETAAGDFFMQVTVPRAITTADILAGDPDKLSRLGNDGIPAEDLLWALSGALEDLRARRESGPAVVIDLRELASVLRFMGASRADMRLSFFYRLIRECGIYTDVPAAIATISDASIRSELKGRFEKLFDG